MKIVHLSDLHFGTESDSIVDDLLRQLNTLNASLVVISGDFTQTASRAEFIKSRRFVQDLKIPVFCVPGNHDIPRFGVAERMLNPYRRYREHIADTLSPVFENELCVIAGINSARRALPHWNWANGAVSRTQLDFLDDAYKNAGDRLRICVLHHPLHRADGVPLDVTVFGRHAALEKILVLPVDLVLSGHVHHASVMQIGKTVFASASTTLSGRLRGQENGFNCIELKAERLEISHFTYNREHFFETDRHIFNL